MTQRVNYILVDYENVQPKDIALLKDGSFKVKVFLGPNQSKIPVQLASALQALGDKAEYIVLETPGHNALDFHISYYLGILSSLEPSAFFHVISKDTGFDPLIKHLKARKILVQRTVCIKEMPCFKSIPDSIEEKIAAVTTRLKVSKPRTQTSLLNSINSLFRKQLTDQQLSSLFLELCTRGIVKTDGVKVSYLLPSESK